MYYREGVVRITRKGQFTIPQRIREQAGLLPNTEVGFEIVRGRVILKPLGVGASAGNARWRRCAVRSSTSNAAPAN